MDSFFTGVASGSTLGAMTQEISPHTEPAAAPPIAYTFNQVVAYNLMRARRASGWTQEECAEELTRATGKQWTNATLSAAERSWKTGRIKEFNANELMAFAVIFEKPVASFLIPIPPDEKALHRYVTRRVAGGDPALDREAKPQSSNETWLPEQEVLRYLLPGGGLVQVLSEDVNRLVRGRLKWTPGTSRWEWWNEEDEAWDEMGAQREAEVDEAETELVRGMDHLEEGVRNSILADYAHEIAQRVVIAIQQDGFRLEQRKPDKPDGGGSGTNPAGGGYSDEPPF